MNIKQNEKLSYSSSFGGSFASADKILTGQNEWKIADFFFNEEQPYQLRLDGISSAGQEGTAYIRVDEMKSDDLIEIKKLIANKDKFIGLSYSEMLGTDY